MLKDAYLYMQRFKKKAHPVLYESHIEFGNVCMCSDGLAGLAEQLSATVHVSWGSGYNGPVKIRAHAPPGDAAYCDTYPPSRAQMREFEKALAKGIKPEWVDERKSEEYAASFKRMKSAMKKAKQLK